MQTLNRDMDMRGFVIALLFACLSSALNNAPAQTAIADPGSAPAANANVLPITIEAGSHANRMYTTSGVTICMPGSITDCQMIERVVVDTGSTGLTVLSSALGPSLSLPQQTLDGNARLAECVTFFGNNTTIAWGPIKLADVQIAGERAKSISILTIDDSRFPDIPGSCLGNGTKVDMMQNFGATAILGVGTTLRDCGKACEEKPLAYYGCSESECQPTTVASEKQLANPVAFFANDDNGVVITLPPFPPGGTSKVAGSLIFGIGTQANNMLGLANVLTVDQDGFFTTVYKGKAYSQSFIDSGAIAIHFLDEEIQRCPTFPDFYCPPTTLSLSATIHGTNGATKAVDFHVDNIETLGTQHPEYAVYEGLAGRPANVDLDLFTWGLPFFIGKSVFVAIDGKTTPAGAGPYFAF